MDKQRLYRRRLRHLLDFTVESCYKVRIASTFLFAVVEDQRASGNVRTRVLNMMVCEIMILTAARLIDERRDARSLKVFEKYGEILGKDVHDRIRALVRKAYDSRGARVLRSLRNEWLAHVSLELPAVAKGRGEEDHDNQLDAAVKHVIDVAEEIAALVAGALGQSIPEMDEYLEARERILEERRPEYAYEW